jgi:hypothetical protein
LAGGVTESRTFRAPQGYNPAVVLSYDARGRLVATGYRNDPDRGLAFWEVESGKVLLEVQPPPDSDLSLKDAHGVIKFSAMNELCPVSNLHLYDFDRGSSLADVPLDGESTVSVSYAPAPGVLAALVMRSSSGRCDVVVWEAATGRTRTLLSNSDDVMGLTISPDGRRLAVDVCISSESPPDWLQWPDWVDELRIAMGLPLPHSPPPSGELLVYDVAAGRVEARFPDGAAAYFSPDGRSMAVTAYASPHAPAYGESTAIYDVPFHPPPGALLGPGLITAVSAYVLARVRLFRRKPA